MTVTRQFADSGGSLTCTANGETAQQTLKLAARQAQTTHGVLSNRLAPINWHDISYGLAMQTHPWGVALQLAMVN